MIYFIQSGECGPIKIGYTNKPITERIRSLQTANAAKLTLLATMNGSQEDEGKFHQLFKTYKLNGEWYKPDGNLLACLLKMALNPETIESFLAFDLSALRKQEFPNTTPPTRIILKNNIEETEKRFIADCLERYKGNVTRTAQELGLSRKGLQLKMIKHNLRHSMPIKDNAK